MLTLAVMTPGKAGTYYQENYYSDEDNVEFSEWWGNGAASLGLEGAVDDPQAFRNILNGKTPDGLTRLRAKPPKGREAIAGTDLTFSAPKSISIAALVGGDKRLLEAHHAAVNRVLGILQERYAETRINKVPTAVDNLLVAKFLHDTNRELEPNLHTHCLVMNLAQDAAGVWRSGTNTHFFQHRMLLGRIYQNELMNQVQSLGYRVERHGDGYFELAGYSRDQIEGFSERHQQILAYLEQEGLKDTTENRRVALFATRKKKDKTADRVALRQDWQGTAEGLGMVHPSPAADRVASKRNDLNGLIGEAIRHNEEGKAIFSQEELESYVFQAPTGHSFDTVQTAIQTTQPQLKTEGGRYTTERALERERLSILLMTVAQGQYAPIAANPNTQALPETLSEYQRQAVLETLSSTDGVLAWEGVAGAGKTFTLKTLVDLATQAGTTVAGFAPDASSAQVLGNELGIETQTIARHLLQRPQRQGATNSPPLWIVDEAGKLSAQDAFLLLQKAKAAQARLLLVGDPKQLGAVAAGSPFASLLDNGIHRSYLGDFRRQKTQFLKHLAQLLYHNLGDEAIDWLDRHGQVTEIAELDDRMAAMATTYLNLSPLEREKTLLLCGTHQERQALTRLVRTGLKRAGSLGEKSLPLTTLSPKRKSQEELQHSSAYAVGDVLIPLVDHYRLRNSQQYRVTAIDGDILTLNDAIQLDFSSLERPLQVNVFQPQTLDIAEGDRLKWTRNNHKLGRVNGRSLTITAIDVEQQTCTFVDDRGRGGCLSLKMRHHLDYGLVSTTYSAQGKTCERVMASFGRDATVSKESVLVALSRAKQDITVWAAHTQSLKAQALISRNDENPSELFREVGLKRVPPCPQHLDFKHWLERVKDSAVAPDVAAVNARSIHGDEVYEYLLDQYLTKFGSGQYVTQPMRRTMDQYESLADGGGVWGDGGIDATCLPNLEPGEIPQQKLFGEFKPNHPRLDQQKTAQKGNPQYRKYEAPRGVPKGIIFPQVPQRLADEIYTKYGVNPTPQERASGFWACVYWYPEIPVVPVEGKKKAEAVISQGYAAIALPSVTGGYRSRQDGVELPKRMLHRELEVFAQPKRPILMGFDQDTKIRTRINVQRDLVRTGALLEEAGCTVSVLKWQPQEGKGIDDLIVNHGEKRFTEVMHHAIPLAWEADKYYHRLYEGLRKHCLEKYQTTDGRTLSEKALNLMVMAKVPAEDRLRVVRHCPALRQMREQGTSKAEQGNYIQELFAYRQRLLAADAARQQAAKRPPSQNKRQQQRGPRL